MHTRVSYNLHRMWQWFSSLLFVRGRSKHLNCGARVYLSIDNRSKLSLSAITKCEVCLGSEFFSSGFCTNRVCFAIFRSKCVHRIKMNKLGGKNKYDLSASHPIDSDQVFWYRLRSMRLHLPPNIYNKKFDNKISARNFRILMWIFWRCLWTWRLCHWHCQSVCFVEILLFFWASGCNLSVKLFWWIKETASSAYSWDKHWMWKLNLSFTVLVSSSNPLHLDAAAAATTALVVVLSILLLLLLLPMWPKRIWMSISCMNTSVKIE